MCGVVQPSRRPFIDPDDPRAPSQAEWNQLSDDERRWVVAQLPSEFPATDASPPEGDVHYDEVKSVREALRDYFRRLRRKVYVGSNLPVYYPGERMFSVDALAVLEADDGLRDSWVVSAEGRGLDFALEIHWLGHKKKDFERNVAWFARLGIREYFVFDARRRGLRGFRLVDAPPYQPIVPQMGRLGSEVLGLELALEGPRLRFYAGSAALPDAADLIARLDGALSDSEKRAEEEARRAEEEARRAEEEARRAEQEARRASDLEQRLQAALAEIERLKSR
jgi:Uma2 family endonuclease